MKENVKITKLPNGATILTKRTGGESFAVAFAVGAGAWTERKEQAGWSHLIEHLLFQGSKGYPGQEDISRSIESVGGRINGYTTDSHTCYHAVVPYDRAAIAVDAIGDLFTRPNLDPALFHKERDVVRTEIQTHSERPEDIFNRMSSRALWHDCYLAHDVGGTDSTLLQSTPDAIRAYYRKWYVGRRTVIAAAGPQTHRELVALVRPYAERFAKGPASLDPKTIAEKRKRQCRETKAPAPFVSKRSSKSTHVAVSLAFRWKGAIRPKTENLWMLKEVLAGKAGRLARKVTDPLGGGFSISVSVDDGAVWVYSYQIPRNKAARAVQGICRELRRLRDEPVSHREFHSRQEAQADGIADSIPESSYAWVQYLIRNYFVVDKYRTVESCAKIYRKATEEGVQCLAQRLFQPKCLSVSVLEPANGDTIAEEIRTAANL